jgi:cation:H+ antiporter
MALSIALLIIGLALLTYSAEHFVVGAGRLALRLNVSAVLVGAVVVGFGTSAPELLVSASAAARDDLNLAAGNVIGSVVANLTLVLGIAALLAPVTVSRTTLLREAPLSIVSVLLFGWMIQGDVTRLEGGLLAGGLLVAMAILVWESRKDARAGTDEVSAVLEELDLDAPEAIDLWSEGLRTLAGLVGTVVGSQMLVEGAIDLADRAGVSSGFIGLSLVAVGTSLPELVTSIVAARKGHTDLIIGNLLGSNMFNGLAIGAAMGLIGPGTVTDSALTGPAAIVMVAVVAGSTLFMLTGRAIVRWEALVLLATYLVTLPLLAADSDKGSDAAGRASTPAEVLIWDIPDG